MPLKRDEAFWKEGMDEKRFALCCIHKIWICLAAALAGAVFAAGIYLGVRQLTMGPKQYRSEVLYSIVYDIDEEGWAWGQLERDGYVGWFSADALGPAEPAPTHRVIAPRSHFYPIAGFKAEPLGAVPMGAMPSLTHSGCKARCRACGRSNATRGSPSM